MHKTLHPVVIGICLLLSALPVDAADNPALEIGGSFSSLASGACCLPTTGSVPVGWAGDITIRLHDWLSVDGEVGGDYETIQTIPPPGFGSPLPAISSRIYAFMGGLRVAVPATRKVRVFGRALIGVTHRAATVEGFEPDPSPYNHLAWQPGGGIDVIVSKKWAVRLGGDWRLTPMSGLLPPRQNIVQPRFTSGIVLRP